MADAARRRPNSKGTADIKGVKGAEAPGGRGERSAAIGAALDTALLPELVRMVDAYDRRPAQRFCGADVVLCGYVVEDAGAGRTRLRITENAPRRGMVVGLKGEWSFADGALHWSIEVPLSGAKFWLGVVRHDAHKNASSCDYGPEDCFYFFNHLDNQVDNFNCGGRQTSVGLVFPPQKTGQSTGPTVFSFAVDLDKRQVRVSRNGVPSTHPFMTNADNLHDFTLYACIEQQLPNYLIFESADK